MSEGEELEEAWAAPGSTALQAWLSLPLSSHYHPARLRPPWCSRPLPAVVPPGRTLGSKSGRWLRAAGHVVPSAPVVAQANNRGGGSSPLSVSPGGASTRPLSTTPCPTLLSPGAGGAASPSMFGWRALGSHWGDVSIFPRRHYQDQSSFATHRPGCSSTCAR